MDTDQCDLFDAHVHGIMGYIKQSVKRLTEFLKHYEIRELYKLKLADPSFFTLKLHAEQGLSDYRNWLTLPLRRNNFDAKICLKILNAFIIYIGVDEKNKIPDEIV